MSSRPNYVSFTRTIYFRVEDDQSRDKYSPGRGISAKAKRRSDDFDVCNAEERNSFKRNLTRLEQSQADVVSFGIPGLETALSEANRWIRAMGNGT